MIAIPWPFCMARSPQSFIDRTEKFAKLTPVGPKDLSLKARKSASTAVPVRFFGDDGRIASKEEAVSPETDLCDLFLLKKGLIIFCSFCICGYEMPLSLDKIRKYHHDRAIQFHEERSTSTRKKRQE